MTWPERAVQAGGALVVVLTLADVFFTVLFPASGRGPIRKPLSRWTWRSFAALGRRLPVPARRRFLSYCGPVLITVTIVTWVLLLVVGWAMVFQPALGAGIHASKGHTDTGWSSALYYSGFTLSTLGTGDVVPAVPLYRLLTVLEAAIGFSVFTLVLTYFMSVYSALASRKSFAASLDHRTFNTGVPVQLLVGLVEGDELPEGRHQLSTLAEFLTHTCETHRSYPVLRYFHFREDRYALPRLLLISLEAATLVRSGLQGKRYAGLIRSSGVFQIAAAGLEVLQELVPRVATGAAGPEERGRWDARFRACVADLATAGVEVVADPAKGAREYVALREQWDRPLRALSTDMLYDWEEIEVVLS